MDARVGRPRKRRREDSSEGEDEAPGAGTSVAGTDSVCFPCGSSLATSTSLCVPGVHGELSEVTKKLKRLISGYTKLHVHRYERRSVHIDFAEAVHHTLSYYGFGELAKKEGLYDLVTKRVWRNSLLDTVVSNVSLLLEATENLERNFSEMLWSRYYLFPRYGAKILPLLRRIENLARNDEVAMRMATSVRSAFKRNTLNALYRIRDAVLNRNWTEVGRRVALINMARPGPCSKSREHIYFREVSLHFRFYVFEIFHVGCQRLLCHNLPNDVTVDSIFEFSKEMFRIESRVFLNRPLGLAILTDLYVLAIVYGREDIQTFIQNESSGSLDRRDAEDNFFLQCYSLLGKYEIWSHSRVRSEERASFLAEQMEAQLCDMKEHSVNVLLDAIIHMLVVSGKQALLLRIITEFCRATPTLLGHCFHRIAQLGDQETADKVLLDTFVQHPDLHPSDPIWLDHVQPCTLAPENFGPTNEVIMKNVSVLFDFLDFGANRRDERAWFLLKSNMESLMLLEGCASLLPSLWEPRRDWWPRFHVVDLSPVGHEYRTFVFNVLYSLSAGD